MATTSVLPTQVVNDKGRYHALGSGLGRSSWLSRSRLVGSFASDCGRRAGQVGRLNSRGLFNAGENPLRGDRADQRQTDPISAKPVPQSMQARHSFAVL